MKKIKIIPFLLLIAMLASVFAPGALAVEPYDAPELTVWTRTPAPPTSSQAR